MTGLLIPILLLVWAACTVGTGLLFKASGRFAFAGRLTGFILGGPGCSSA